MNTYPITQDVRNVAQRDLRMAALSLLERGGAGRKASQQRGFCLAGHRERRTAGAGGKARHGGTVMSWLMLFSASLSTRAGERVPRLLART